MIHHIAIWVQDIEKIKAFYTKYFNCVSGEKYINQIKKFESYFLTFENGAKIELMFIPGMCKKGSKKFVLALLILQ